jgi:diguanylate cyclase (GGDEF)-like protein
MAEMSEEHQNFGPNEAREFLRRNRLPSVPLDDLTPKVCAALMRLSLTISKRGTEIHLLREKLATMKREHKELVKKHGHLERSHEQTQMDLADTERQLMEQSALIQTDGLTGVGNRHGFNMEMARMIARRKEAAGGERRSKNNPFPNAVVVMFDINDFKQLNSEHSHACGDEALKHIAHILKSNFRKGDYVARTGGDEFVAILYNTSVAAAEKTAEKIRDQVLRSDFFYHGAPIQGHVSDKEFWSMPPANRTMSVKIPLSIAFGVHEVTKDDTPESIMEVTSLEMLARKEGSKSYAAQFRDQEDRLLHKKHDGTGRA